MTEPTTYHAVLYQDAAGVQSFGPRCKTRRCAIDTIKPLDGTTVLGVVELDIAPGTAHAFWKRHQGEALVTLIVPPGWALVDNVTDWQIINALDAEYGEESRLFELVGSANSDESPEHKVRVVRALLKSLAKSPSSLAAAPAAPAAQVTQADVSAETYIRDWCPDHVKDYVASLAATPAVEVDEATRLFNAGWYACAKLADRDDLPHDVGSPFHAKALAAALKREVAP